MNRKQMLRFLLLSSDTGGTLEGVPPLTYKAKKAGFLTNYRIYGQTVNGESVGELVTSGEHAGEYNVPVTVEGKNLFDGEILQGFYSFSNGIYYGSFGSYKQYVCTNKIECKSNTTYTIQVYAPEIISYSYGFVWWDENLNFISSDISTQPQSSDITTFTATAPNNAKYMAFDLGSNNAESTIVPSNVSWIMLNKGSTALPYEPYQPPVTTNLYLPEPIKMVGDEPEYIDYGEQKQHRVRANYLQSSDFEAGAIFTGPQTKGYSYIDSKTPPGMANFDSTRKRSTNLITIIGTYTISIADGWEFGTVMFPNDKNSGELFIYNTEPVTISNCTFAIQIRKTDISDISSADISDYKIMLNKGSEPLPYEPYIENTDLDVTLPALPTLPGTNVLSVGAEVQPSMVEVMGRIKAVPTN